MSYEYLYVVLCKTCLVRCYITSERSRPRWLCVEGEGGILEKGFATYLYEQQL